MASLQRSNERGRPENGAQPLRLARPGRSPSSGRAGLIRPAGPADAASVLERYAPIVRESFVSFELEPPPADEMARRIDAGIEWLVFEEAGDILGYAYAMPFHPRAAYRWSVEVSVYVPAAAEGRGLGRHLVEGLLDEVRRRGFVNAFAGIALPNPASVRLFEGVGFEQIALQRSVGFKLGAWRDVGWWQLQLREPTVPPPQLIS